MRKLAAIAALLLSPVSVSAICLGGHPSVHDETAYAAQVVIGEATSEYKILDPDDPEGFTATIYVFKVHSTLKGSAVQTVHLWMDNSSSRYAMALRQLHLLFLQAADDGFYYVNSCGNSEPFDQDSQKYKEVLRISANGSNTLFKVTPDGAPQFNR